MKNNKIKGGTGVTKKEGILDTQIGLKPKKK
jgi:hypothetical protein